jgi:serine/threonine-protein kinase
VKSQSLADAEQILQQHGVRYTGSPKQKNSSTIAKGHVISVDPPAGRRITKDHAVQITISLGPPVRLVPTIAQGTALADARKTLTDEKFTVHESEQYSADVPAGSVISVSPTGYRVLGSTVDVVVSKGPEFVTVPDIALLTPFPRAKAQLEQLGFVVAREGAGFHRRNLVVDQDLRGLVHVGSTVTLTVI